MSRLATALVDQAREEAEAPGAESQPAWLLIEGIDVALARALLDRWPDDLPPAFVAGPADEDFGAADLRVSSATHQRNKGGLCLIVCEGQRVPDGQSVVGFHRCGPEQLLDERGIRRLASRDPDVESSPGMEAVFRALVDPRLEAPPAARALAAFFDAVGAGGQVGEALPHIGGFRDTADPAALRPERVRANLNLAAGRSSAERLAPSSLAEIRERANRRFEDLPGGKAAGDSIVEMLLRRAGEILLELSFDDAVRILEQPPAADLPEQIRQDLQRYARQVPDNAKPVLDALPLADRLEDPLTRREAAQGLLELDLAHQSEVLSGGTRRRLKSQRRDRSVSEPSLETGLVRALDNLSSAIKAVELRQPQVSPGGSSEAALKALVSVAAAHVRLAPMLRRLQAAYGARVEAALLVEPGPELQGALTQLQSKGAGAGRQVKLAVRGTDRGDTVEINWTPSQEDFALLVSLSAFSRADSESLSLEGRPSEGTLTLSGLHTARAPDPLRELAETLGGSASAIIRDGYEPEPLREWARAWREATGAAASAGRTGLQLDALASAGCIRYGSEIAMTALAPLKSEWLADRTDAWLELVDLAAQTAAGMAPRSPGDTLPPPLITTARALGAATAARYPGFFAVSGRERPLLPATDGLVFSSFGEGDANIGHTVVTPPTEPIQVAITKLVDLHPEAAQHFRCIAWGNNAADLLVGALLGELRRRNRIGRAEVFCVAGEPGDETLAAVDDFARGQPASRIQLRYLPSLDEWPRSTEGGPQVHLAFIEGITHEASSVNANIEDVPCPAVENDVLFTPRTWVRPNRSRVLLAPPRMSPTGVAWHRLMTAVIEGEWPPEDGATLRVPELRTDAAPARTTLASLHERALWVATLDRYATRDTIQQAAGPDVAILHQERRAAGDAVYGLVISQRSGGSADRAIARSLRASNLLDDTAAPGVARGLREAAARGYGILALRAATTGSGINELIGHVAAFHRLTSDATPWPLPPGCRVVLVSLDEYASWFGTGKRADLLALALSPEEGGVHAANIEVKTVKDAGTAAHSSLIEAREQLRKTLIDSRFAAYPNASVFSRLWLNRIVEAAIGVCRENSFKLTREDLAALDNFRVGDGVLEWAGVAMVFTPGAVEPAQHSHIPLMSDRVPIVQTMVSLTPELLEDAASSDGTRLRTVATGRALLPSSSKRRQFGRTVGPPAETPAPAGPPSPDVPATVGEADGEANELAAGQRPTPQETVRGEPDVRPDGEAIEPDKDALFPSTPSHPMLGWDVATDEPVEWRVIGQGALSNGHVEIYGTSGAGKTQFVMSLLTQMKAMGSRFGVCDFKNDYAADFPARAGANFYDLWEDSLPFNPLAIDDPSRRNLQALTIELRDSVDIAARAYARLGHRQLTKLQQAFEEGYEQARVAGRTAPTLQDIHELLDDDLLGVIGDLTGTELFGDGPPLGTIIDHDVIIGLNRIPGTGMTTTLAAGFILAALYLKLLEMPQVANEVRYTLVIDEAHRVGHFHSVGSMVRELRSKGLAVVLATQRPGDLPAEATTNAQTKIYMRLPDAQSAREAARALDPSDKDLPEMIRTLKNGEAFVAFSGSAPRLVRLRQFWRDHAESAEGAS